ncbi:MAG: S-layer homology domain-containing protein [Nostocaceae cyanobacterium]|nr:S-layer homology domain-containing protein [Nostocaceae cyanobacterium]
MVNSTLVATIYVNPVTGNDSNNGSRLTPYKSLTRAVAASKTRGIIQLASGTYNTANGEVFPLVIPAGVMVVGNEASKGQGIVISGSGKYQSSSFGEQNITLLLLGNAQIMGITVTNPHIKGTGIWIESTSPTVTNNTLSHCGREGVFVSGNAKPGVLDNLFVDNSAGGLAIAGHSKGEILRNIFQKNGLGIAVSDFAAPLIAHNTISGNGIGIALSRESRPVLRHNSIENNTQGGLLVNGKANPDLGSNQDPAGNIWRYNGNFDVNNATFIKLLSAGNQLNPGKIKGLVELIATTENTNNKVSITTSFADMAGHWATAFVEALLKAGLISGFPDGTFRPEAPITRAEYAAVIAKTFHLPAKQTVRNFQDVQPEFWGASAIAKAMAMGFISGFPDGTFRPGQNLTRVQAIVSLVNGLEIDGGNTDVLTIYGDRAQIPSYATNAVAIATQKLLVVNYPQTGQLEPLRDITRGEVAALIYQALVASGKQKPIISPYIVNADVTLPSFTDLQGHWAEPFIRALVNMELTSGFADGSYRPDKPMTRAQYASLIAAAFNPSPKRRAANFTDISKDFWAYKAIEIAAQAGFVGGFSDRTFRPQENVQRLQVIVSLVSGLGLPAAHTDLLLGYKDYNRLPDYARTAIATATAQKIIVNYPEPEEIKPLQPATRGEVAAMVYQALVTIGRCSVINCPYIVSHDCS